VTGVQTCALPIYFAQDLPDKEKQVLTATLAPTAAAVFEATITTAAWKTKPSWCVITANDRTVPPELQKAEAAAMKATSITIPSSHVPMLSHPKEVADFIEQAAANAESRMQPSQQSSQRIAGGSSEDLKKWRSLQAHP